MEGSSLCKHCKNKNVVRDEMTGNLVCEVCGIEQAFDNFQIHFGGVTDDAGTVVRIGDDFTFRERKIYNAKKNIEEITFTFGFSLGKTDEVIQMIDSVTEGEFGTGNWFSILIGACCYVSRRKDNMPLSMTEVASVIACDVHEIGRMVVRVVDFLELKLPEFDIASSLERYIYSIPSFAEVCSEKKDKLAKQGRFLIQCLVKWFVTTGRQPIPVVAAVLVLVAELNQVKVQIEYISKEIHAGLNTSTKRYRELLRILVKVAQAFLPWGKNVTVKNIVHNAPHLFQIMELKSRLKPGEKRKYIEKFGHELEEIVCGCLSKEIEVTGDYYCVENDSQYYDIEDRSGTLIESVSDLDKLKISQECLTKIYKNFSNDSDVVKATYKKEEGRCRKRKKGLGPLQAWWKGNSELSKKLSLEEVLKKDVGYNNLAPSFVAGNLARQRRREMIDAARLRIGDIMEKPISSESENGKEMLYGVKGGKINWEDCIIEILLLHRVKEEEIEQGHYITLLDLHVFDSVNASELFTRAKRQCL
ncbi:hypothetical protein MKX01_030411 [Papaver californicum]|nr:hypothetical protein MKX01_030411 [Papaver californicum]